LNERRAAAMKPATVQALRDAKALLDEGVLTSDEFAAKKKELLAADNDEAPEKTTTKKRPAVTTTNDTNKKKPKKQDLESLSNKELKARCKELGLSQTGEKGTLVWRLKLKERSAALTLDDGRSPFELKAGELKKTAASFGVNPMGTNDELLEGLVAALEKKKPNSGEKTTSSVDVAKRVLELFDADDFEGILALGGGGGSSSSTASLQKCYRRLSLVLHPDKLRNFDRATQAFQAVVTALERLTAPKVEEEEEVPRQKKKRIARSNEGCVRTRVRCPRCREPWGESQNEGLPDWAYNLMMTGLRAWTCSTCLCEFGCVSALHECRKCGQPFDYSYEDYHSKVTCEKCRGEFGFFQFNMTDRALEDAIEAFAGCAVIISHDRFFLDRLCTHILAFEGEAHVEWFEGNFEDYEEDKKRRLGADALEPKRLKHKKFVR